MKFKELIIGLFAIVILISIIVFCAFLYIKGLALIETEKLLDNKISYVFAFIFGSISILVLELAQRLIRNMMFFDSQGETRNGVKNSGNIFKLGSEQKKIRKIS